MAPIGLIKNYWGIPPTLIGLSRADFDYYLTGEDFRWIVECIKGQHINGDGRGLTFVGDDADTDCAATIQDLVRSATFSERNRLDSSWMRWVSLAALHRMSRGGEGSQYYGTVLSCPLLVISGVAVEEHWTLSTLKNTIRDRSAAGRPTLVTMSSHAYETITQVVLDDSPAIQELGRVLGSVNHVVER